MDHDNEMREVTPPPEGKVSHGTTARGSESCVKRNGRSHLRGVVEMRGLEPLTPAMRTQCSSS